MDVNAPDTAEAGSPAVREHRAHAPAVVRCAVLTISDTRTVETDDGGRAIHDRLDAAGHEVIDQRILPDEPDAVRAQVSAWIKDDRVQVVLTTGGTGIAGRDTTYEALVGLLDKRIDGFGELFRMLSYAEVGSAAMLSRAVGGLAGGTVILAMPGSPAGVALAMDRLVVPEIGHMAGEAARGRDRTTTGRVTG